MPAHTPALVSGAAALEALRPEWTELFYASATPNPFAHPAWLLTWARHFIGPAQVYVVTVRDEEGALIGVAPFYRQRYSPRRAPAITALQLLGTGQHVHLTELPQILTKPGEERAVLRAMMHYLGERAAEWDWVEVALTPEQGWFEPQWLPREGPGEGSFVLHKATRPCVVLPLPPSWEELRAGMKRNIKESLRRGSNSLTREGHAWEVVAPDGPAGLAQAVDEIVGLHGARSEVQGKVRHPDYFADPADRAFLRDVAGRMFQAGHLTPCLLQVDGRTAAGRVLLHANGVTFFSFSGFDPAWWPYNVATTLVAECLRRAIARGDTLANLSPGPDVAKLRWSESLRLYQEFIMVGPRRRSRLAFSVFWQLRAADLLRRESRRHEEA